MGSLTTRLLVRVLRTRTEVSGPMGRPLDQTLAVSRSYLWLVVVWEEVIKSFRVKEYLEMCIVCVRKNSKWKVSIDR